MNDVAVIAVPLDSGHLDVRMASGVMPLSDRIAVADVQRVVPEDHWRSELRTTFAAHHLVADAVRAARGRGALPVVLAGDCNTTVGVVAGLGGEQRLGVLWLDAHADFNTPETDGRGYLDGQGLAMLVGRCWTAHTRQLRGFEPVPEDRVLLAAARDLDPAEQAALDRSGVRRLDQQHPAEMVEEFVRDVDSVHVHVDVDALDPSLGVANDYAAAGGMQPEDVVALVRAIAVERPVAALTVASWDRDRPDAGRLVDVVPDLVEDLVAIARGSRRPAGR